MALATELLDDFDTVDGLIGQSSCTLEYLYLIV